MTEIAVEPAPHTIPVHEMGCPCKSGKPFEDCHGKDMKRAELSTEGVVLTEPKQEVKLDLAAGQSVRDGFEGVDLWPQSKHVQNLMRYPWKWADHSVDELHCSHFVEHIPMIYVDDEGVEVPMGTSGARDAFFRFFDECWRILKPGCWMTVICPCARNNRAFQDPTHRRFIVAESFLYLSAEWRKINRLDHYGVVSDWGVTCNPFSIQAEINLLSDAARNRRFHHEWNAIEDWIAKIQKKPPT